MTSSAPLALIFEVDVVAGLLAVLADGARPQHDDLDGTASHDHRGPWPQALGCTHHAALAVQEQRVDREAHEQHRDVVRLRDPQRLTVGEPAVEEKPDAAREEQIGGVTAGTAAP